MTRKNAPAIAGLKAIFFDLDDTLFDRRSSQRLSLKMIVKDFHYLFGETTEETLLRCFLDADAEAMQEFSDGASMAMSRLLRSRRFLGKLGIDERFAPDITASYLRHYPMCQTPVLGATSLIMGVAPRFSLGIISNGSPEVQYQKLERLGLKQLFQCIVLSEELGIRKPDRRIFTHAAAEIGRDPDECLHVGDNYEADVVGSRAAGLKSCWFNRDRVQPPQSGIKPDIEIHELSELPELLDATGC